MVSTVIPWPEGLHSQEMKERVASAKVLAVGAGGIGCELLKTLVLSGFRSVDVIDLDTIEISNLNRQFLFRKHHVGQSKAAVAAEAVQRMRPNIHVTAHHANVKESRFDVDFFRQFDMVLNGLDNLDARRHVNRMCLAAKVPLVESGTAGYLGQTSVHVAGVTECFDCQPKPTQKTYAVCTIRTSPEKPIHCVVWAKDLLFQRLFGPPEESSDIDSEGLMTRREGETSMKYAERVFEAAFSTGIKNILESAAASEEDVFKGRQPPKPLLLAELQNGIAAENGILSSSTKKGVSPAASLGLCDQNAVWSSSQNAAVFLQAVHRIVEERGDEIGSLTFDKDDDLAVEFVTAAANLRAACYHISAISLFDAKGMAGNIIHAIATTNAIIAGLIVQEALKLLASGGNPSLAPCRSTFLRQDVSSKRLLAPVALEPPNPACVVCGTARLEIRLDTTAWTLGEFISKILKGRLSMVAPTVTFGSFLYEEGEDLEPDEVDEYARHLSKKLSDLPSGGIRNNVHVELTDQAQALRVQVVVSQQDTWNEETHPDRFTIAGALPEAKAEASPEPEAGARDAEASMAFQQKKVLAKEDDDGALVLVDDEEEPTAKRKRRLNEEIVDDNAKRVKMGEGSQEEDVIELLD